MLLTGCARAGSQGASGSGSAQGAVDLLLNGQHSTNQYSIHITACRHDAAAHEVIFSGKEMAVFAWKTQDALRISDPGNPVRITAYRKGQPLSFSASSCQNDTSKGQVNLDCKQNGNHLSVTVRHACVQ